jgi:hypothetical protein
MKNAARSTQLGSVVGTRSRCGTSHATLGPSTGSPSSSRCGSVRIHAASSAVEGKRVRDRLHVGRRGARSRACAVNRAEARPDSLSGSANHDGSPPADADADAERPHPLEQRREDSSAPPRRFAAASHTRDLGRPHPRDLRCAIVEVSARTATNPSG